MSLLFLLLVFLSHKLNAQKLQFEQPLTPKALESSKKQIWQNQILISNPLISAIPKSDLIIPNYFVPQYARENPSGYSYLCRLELKAEDELPLGIWLRADETSHPGGNLYLRLKMIRF